MNKKLLRILIIVLFVGASVLPNISGYIEIERNSILNQNNTTSTFSSVLTDWWPMFHHDLMHSGYSTSEGPETNTIAWTYMTGWGIESSSAIADGKVYFGSIDGCIYCLNSKTGSTIWSHTTGDIVVSSPAVADDKIYIGSYDGNVYCLNANNGSKIWNYLTGRAVRSSPAIAIGKVYIGSCDGNVYCLNANNGSKIWNYTTGDAVVSSPAVADDKIYIGSYDGNVYCLNANNGSKIWNYTTGSLVQSSPAIANGKVYIGSCDGNVYCLNANNGSKIWNYTTGDSVLSSPAVANNMVYIGSDDKNMYCLNADNGSKIWSYTTGGWVESSPTIADGKVYIGSYDYKVYCLNADTGAKIWDHLTGDFVFSSPAVADGKVYIGSANHKIYCFYDFSIPFINITYPIEKGWYKGIINITGVAYDPDGEIKNIAISFDNGQTWLPVSSINPWYYEWDTKSVSDQKDFIITARCTDNDDKTSFYSVNVNIDNTPPHLWIVKPAKGHWHFKNEQKGTTIFNLFSETVVFGFRMGINVQIDVIDPPFDEPPFLGNESIEKVVYYLDGKEKTTTFNSGSGYWEDIWIETFIGTRFINASIIDKAGNRNDFPGFPVFYLNLYRE